MYLTDTTTQPCSITWSYAVVATLHVDVPYVSRRRLHVDVPYVSRRRLHVDVPYVSRRRRALDARAQHSAERLHLSIEKWRKAYARVLAWREIPRTLPPYPPLRPLAACVVAPDRRHLVHRRSAVTLGRWLAGSGRRAGGKFRERTV